MDELSKERRVKMAEYIGNAYSSDTFEPTCNGNHGCIRVACPIVSDDCPQHTCGFAACGNNGSCPNDTCAAAVCGIDACTFNFCAIDLCIVNICFLLFSEDD